VAKKSPDSTVGVKFLSGVVARVATMFFLFRILFLVLLLLLVLFVIRLKTSKSNSTGKGNQNCNGYCFLHNKEFRLKSYDTFNAIQFKIF